MIRVLRIVLLCFALLVGCEDGGARSEWVETASEAHELADAQLASGDRKGFETTLLKVIDAKGSKDIAPADRRAVTQDIYFRLAESALARKDPNQALRWADTGLALGGTNDVFLANLYVVQGKAYEALEKKTEANQSFYEALLINDELLTQLLDDAN